MIQGTMSNAGKSLLAAGLCRIFHQDGYRVAPFKSQNMALNSFITREGLEMGRAQVMQAEAAGIEPSVLMNPILLKPTNDTGSQVIVNGEVLGNMSAREYFSHKKELIPDIMKAYHALEEQYDIIVIEGAGSPAEINLKADDIVNMGMAKLVDAPVLLVGDIDRGGVFAQLYGTVELLEPDERDRIKGLIINKFRGDKTILDPGVVMLEEKTHIPVVGVAPYLHIEVEDEDSLTERFTRKEEIGLIDLAVIRLPRISNFTDFNPFERIEGVSLRYVSSVSELKNPDMILLPGTKNTMEDLLWMRQNGLEAAVLKAAAAGKVIFGVCGGFQMLGDTPAERSKEWDSCRWIPYLPVRRREPARRALLEKQKAFLPGSREPGLRAMKSIWEKRCGKKKQKHSRSSMIRTVLIRISWTVHRKEMCTVRMCTAFSTKKKLPSGSWKHLQRIRELPWSRFTVSITRHSKRHSTIFSQMRCASIST